MFAYYYIRSMRVYYGFVTGTTTLVGALAGGRTLVEARTWLLFAMGFLAWGFNQIFSDWYDRHEDAINAPHRPMVTGALRTAPAFAVSLVGLGAIAAVGFCLSPWTLVFLGIGGVLNVAYSLLKRVPVLNCLVYACAISCCALFGYAGAHGGLPASSSEFHGILLKFAAGVLPVHVLMCHNSYYKDVAGDRAAGVRTLQTLCPPFAVAVSLSLMALELFVLLGAWGPPMEPAPVLAFLVALVLSVRHFAALRAGRYHQATKTNCQLCVALLHQSSLRETWPVGLVSLAVVELLFLWYRDEKE